MRRVPITLCAAAVVLIALTAVSCDDDSAEIELGEVVRADIVEIVDAPAIVVAKAAATLTSVADGTLAELRVDAGDAVRAGDVLAVIDSPSAQQRLEQAGAALDAANQAVPGGVAASGDLVSAQRSTNDAATTAFDQAREAAGHILDETLRDALLAQVDVAEQQYAAAAATASEAVQAVQLGVESLSSAVSALGTAQQLQARQAYDLALSMVDALTLRAPFDGVVQLGGSPAGAGADQMLGDLLGAAAGGLADQVPSVPGPAAPPPGVAPAVPVGAPVSPGTPVLTVVDTGELGLVAEVDETDILLVSPEVTAEAELDAALGARYQARVASVDVLPTPSARGGVGYGVRLVLGEGTWPDGSDAPTPRPGMSAVAHLRVREATDALAVPAAAVLRFDGEDVVWTVRDGEATRTPVTLGVQGADLVEIVSGLRVGEQIVVRGADQVTPGQRLP